MYKNLISLVITSIFIVIALGSATQKEYKMPERQKTVAYEKTKTISLMGTNPQNLIITGNSLVINEIGYNNTLGDRDLGVSLEATLSGNILVKNQDLNFDITLSQPSVESDYTGKYDYPIVFNYKIANNTSEPIKIIWDEVTYVDNDDVAHPVVKLGVQLVDRAQSIKDVIIPPQSKVDEIIYPSDYIRSSGGWTSRPVLENLGNGESVTIFLPMQIKGVTTNYSFTFQTKEDTVQPSKSAPQVTSVDRHCKLYNKKSDNIKYNGICKMNQNVSDMPKTVVITIGDGDVYKFEDSSYGYKVHMPNNSWHKRMATLNEHSNEMVFKWGKWTLTVGEP